ncbi:hypothetical protein NUW58_g1876 [Xylaria curta]|uniref:Uncharacterized protein n=1 Tax=Xylaria curta TaxID=42375 RepID=A0ACC1PIC9_9PEZI|nr:hypothetical protein NUW58_g1876 [Xylaria curta]
MPRKTIDELKNLEFGDDARFTAYKNDRHLIPPTPAELPSLLVLIRQVQGLTSAHGNTRLRNRFVEEIGSNASKLSRVGVDFVDGQTRDLYANISAEDFVNETDAAILRAILCEELNKDWSNTDAGIQTDDAFQGFGASLAAQLPPKAQGGQQLPASGSSQTSGGRGRGLGLGRGVVAKKHTPLSYATAATKPSSQTSSLSFARSGGATDTYKSSECSLSRVSGNAKVVMGPIRGTYLAVVRDILILLQQRETFRGVTEFMWGRVQRRCNNLSALVRAYESVPTATGEPHITEFGVWRDLYNGLHPRDSFPAVRDPPDLADDAKTFNVPAHLDGGGPDNRGGRGGRGGGGGRDGRGRRGGRGRGGGGGGSGGGSGGGGGVPATYGNPTHSFDFGDMDLDTNPAPSAWSHGQPPSRTQVSDVCTEGTDDSILTPNQRLQVVLDALGVIDNTRDNARKVQEDLMEWEGSPIEMAHFPAPAPLQQRLPEFGVRPDTATGDLATKARDIKATSSRGFSCRNYFNQAVLCASIRNVRAITLLVAMTSATSQQLKALLAMPPALRPVLLSAFAPPIPQRVQSRLLSTSPLRRGAAKYPNVAALLIPEFRTSSIAEIAPDDLFKTSSLSSAPGEPVEDELTKLYTKNPAAFVYAESDFYKLRKNTRVPEVCVLGRSNVGKSSFINALANRPKNGLAHVSSKAGKTRSINTYGFGPAPTIKELQAQGSQYKDEDIPTHTFHLVDMPGYGHASLKEWGKNISLYLNKRNFVKGAIVLIDAEVGPKDSDFHLLELLSTAQLKTAIVLTKADKAKKGLEGLRETCIKVWDGIRAIEARTTDGNWIWEKDVYVTAVGAKDAAVVKSTVTTARLAVARLAGLMKDERPNSERNKRWSGKMISFDDLQYAPGKSVIPETNSNAKMLTELVRDTPSASNNTSGQFKAKSALASLEQAAKAHRLSMILLKSLTNGTRHATAYGACQQERKMYPPRIFKGSIASRQRRQMLALQRRFREQTTRAQRVVDRRLRIQERRDLAVKDAEAKWPATGDVGNTGNTNQAMGASEFETAFSASEGLEDIKKNKRSTA